LVRLRVVDRAIMGNDGEIFFVWERFARWSWVGSAGGQDGFLALPGTVWAGGDKR
jgi:hypothetical protein